MISVVIPLYNKESFIIETITSVLKQTFTDFEVVVIDDGSTDNSVSLVRTILDPRVKLVTQNNAGVAVARNRGINEAKFSWVSFLDADDWWAPTFLEEIVRAIEKYPNEVLLASGRCRVFPTKEQRYAHPLLPRDGETAILNYFQVIASYLPLINSSNVVIKRSHFDLAGYFRPGQKQHEDHDLWMRLASEEAVVFVNKKLSYYRKVDTGSASANVYKAKDFNRYLQTILEVVETTSEENKKHLKQYANRFAALTYLKQYGNYTNEERMFLTEPLKKLLVGRYKAAYKLSCILPFNLYPLLKAIRA